MRNLLIFFSILMSIYLFQSPVVSAKSDESPIKLDLYVMGQCPFAAEVENTISIILQETKQPIQVNFYYIVNETPDGNFQSPHGIPEVEEDMRQLAIQKFYPKQFWKYLRSRNSDYRRDEWRSHAYWAGLPYKEIEKKVKEEGKLLLRENSQKARQMGIKFSPTLYINDRLYQGSRSIPDLTRALLQNVKKGQSLQYSIPRCFSDVDCTDPSRINSYRCVEPGKLSARCESLMIPLKIVVPTNNFPLDLKPLQVLMQRVPNLKPSTQQIVWDSPEGQELLKRIPTQTLPLCVWGDNFALLDSIPSLQDAGFLQTQEDRDGKKIYWLSSKLVSPSFYLNRPHQPNRLDLFVMSQCPFGIWAENQIIPVARQNGITIEIHYIIQERTSNTAQSSESMVTLPSVILSSLHGPAELEEDFRRVCVKKYFPDHYLDYILERNKNFQSSLWEQAATKVLGEEAIPTIRNCVNNEAKDLLLQSYQLTKELEVDASPTVLWENRYRFNQLNKLKQSVATFNGIEIKEGECRP